MVIGGTKLVVVERYDEVSRQACPVVRQCGDSALEDAAPARVFQESSKSNGVSSVLSFFKIVCD
jgi:hypothetical protein